VIFTSGFSAMNCSAAAWANGNTVLEPSIAIVPDSSPPPDPELDSSPHAATPSARTLAVTGTSHLNALTKPRSLVSVDDGDPARGTGRVCYPSVSSV
jgi:hypothetical protein